MTIMEIRKNNDIRFKLVLVDNEGNPVTNIKDIKCTVVNSGAPRLHINHFHFKHWHMYREHNKVMHSVMCGYDHPYNVIPVNMKEYCTPFVEDTDKTMFGAERLPVMVNQTEGIVDAYFAASKQRITGKYNMLVEIQCWDPTWADKGYHTHTVQLDDVCTLKDGDNHSYVSPSTIQLDIVLPHQQKTPEEDVELIPTIYHGTCDEHDLITVLNIPSSQKMHNHFTVTSPCFYVIYPATVDVVFSENDEEVLILKKNKTASGEKAEEVYIKEKQDYQGTDYYVARFDFSSMDGHNYKVELR